MQSGTTTKTFSTFNQTIHKVSAMTEEDAWKFLEEKQKMEAINRERLNAWNKSGQFVDSESTQLGTMTLRKAFEIGYRTGYQDRKQESEK